jgi:acyl-[acyl-carrier-protein]-phospholipid O-acyltransferase/long-chain-fatty-acid--[acyl-carrier-protein] ligase
VSFDEDGYVTILGRAKRFAKIAGEMVSLAAVEQLVSGLWPDDMHAVVALPDARKGEQLVLLTERGRPAREEISASARTQGASELMVPRQIFSVDKLPLLGSGKIDHPGAKALAEELLAGPGTT